MKNRRWAAIALLAFCVMTLFGCGKRYVQDGPGMVNDRPWKAFALSCTDSCSQGNFWFTVQDSDFGVLLSGECRDEHGNEYLLEEGVELSGEDLRYLRGLWLGELPDAVPEKGGSEPTGVDESSVELVLFCLDGTEQEKVLPKDIAIEIYERFLPYFINYN